MIYQVYKRGGFVRFIPRWILRFKPGVFEYEFLSISRGPISGRVNAVMLPLNMH